MNFNTLEFILIFLPVVLLLFYVLPIRGRLPLLSAASIVFYGTAGLIPLYFLIASIAWAYVTGLIASRYRNKKTLIVSISFPLFVLFLFKYLNLTLFTISAESGTREYFHFFLSVVLPAGISFYTFQIVAYSIDVADGRIQPEKNFIKLFTYVSLFCQLIAGPIVRYNQIRDQLSRIATEKYLNPDVGLGLKYFSIGLFGKIFFADILHSVRSRFALEQNVSSLDAAYSILTYSFQIYYDFWAYSLMAIGLGKLFSIDLPINFREPYLSASPREFWRQWHITLSYWLRDYMYLRLGGNRSYVRNIAIVFVTVGLWHGAGWNFALWGIYHGLFVIVHHVVRKPWDTLPRPIRVATTFTIVSLGWPLFYSDINQYTVLLGQLFALHETAGGRLFGVAHWGYLAAIAAWTFLARENYWLYNTEFRRVIDWPMVHAVLCCVATLFFSFRATFIYFRF